MQVSLRLAAVLSLGLVLSGCAASSNSGSHGPTASEVVGVAEVGSDVGDDRPQVSYDGLMIRRREVLALRIDTTADLRRISRQLSAAAGHRGAELSAISPSVLDAIDLERVAPDLVLSLAAGATPTAGRRAMRIAVRAARGAGARVQAHALVSVLVHDLRFTVRTPRPAAVSRAIAREGILSDALGTYTTLIGARRLDVLYTGPLLSDHLLLSVRRGMARSAHVVLRAAKVAPRSDTGPGIFLSDEPTPPPAGFSVSSGDHDHH